MHRREIKFDVINKKTENVDVKDDNCFVEGDCPKSRAIESKTVSGFSKGSFKEPFQKGAAVIVGSVVSEKDAEVAGIIHHLDEWPSRFC